MEKKVFFGHEARKGILGGAEILAKAVMATMGPSGHCVIISNNGSPIITKDGVTVAKYVDIKDDPLQIIGANLLKSIAAKTAEQAGDGTTTATVLAYALLSEGIKHISSGLSPIKLKKGMELALEKIVEFLLNHRVIVNDKNSIVNVGTISANGDREIGELLYSAIEKVGVNGIITVESGKSLRTILELAEGMQINSGFLSPYFINNSERAVCELNDCYVFLTTRKLTNLNEILPLLELVARTSRPLLIIADDIEGEALHTLIVNKMRGTLLSCAVKAPSYGSYRVDILHDITSVIGGEVFDASNPIAIQKVKIEQLGVCKKAIVSRNNTVFVGKGNSEKMKERIKFLENVLTNDTTLDDIAIKNYRERLARLSGGIAVIKVGGSTEIEINEKKDRIDDALHATMAAVQEGVVPGGGCALLYASKYAEENLNNIADSDIHAGIKIVLRACLEPIRTIVNNTGSSPDIVINELLQYYEKNKNNLESVIKYGYDAYCKKYGNLFELGVIDPVKVTRLALEHAVSTIGLVLTSDCVVINDKIYNNNNGENVT